jgi:uroporphyrin-III C-methyltransferase
VSGVVYLVGAGPGDPQLITVLGLDRLRRADVVVYDRLVSPELLAEAPPEAERIFVGKAAGDHTCHQDEINALLIRHAREGRTVVRLKGGDPFVFGRGSEEVLACAEAGVACEVIPGVSSAIGVPERAGIPLTQRTMAGGFAVVTGHCVEGDRQDWATLARIETLVILMGLAKLPEICGLLLFHGRGANTPVAVIEQGTLPGERIVVATLGTIAGDVALAGIKPPATIVIGEVVRIRERLMALRSELSRETLEEVEEVVGVSS